MLTESIVSVSIAVIAATARFEYESRLMRKRKDQQLDTQKQMLLELQKIRESVHHEHYLGRCKPAELHEGKIMEGCDIHPECDSPSLDGRDARQYR